MLASLKGLCPSGVLSVPLQTLWVRGPKSKVGVRKAQAMTEGTVPCYTSGEAVYKVTEYLVDGDYIFVNDGGSADFKYHEGKAYYTDHVVAITTKESIKAKYLYYYLQNTKEYIDANLFRGSGLKNLSITELGNYLIPLPPLPVQEEIVRILDTFTELTAELTAELAAELTARKKQYEFYREELLGFEGRADVEWKKLGDIGKLIRGVRVTKRSLKPDGVYPVISGGVKPMGMLDKKNRVKNSITVAQYGSAGVVLWQEEDFWANDVCYTFELGAGISERYLYHVLKSLQLSIYAMVNRDAVPYHLPRNVFERLLIPTPPLSEQAEIVAILDQFDTLTNSLTEGISAEIEARQKQYEFYREKLLTF